MQIAKGKAEEMMVTQVLKEHAYDLTFPQLAEKTGIASSVLCRHFKNVPGWRQCGKQTRPLLEAEAHQGPR